MPEEEEEEERVGMHGRVEERAEESERKEWKREKCRIFCYARPVSLILCLPEKCV